MFNELAKQVHQGAKDKGFYDDGKARNIGERLCLIHAEVSEALEADRNNNYCPVNIMGVVGWKDDESFITHYKETVKGTFEEEMADIIIRVLDMCAFKNIDIDGHVKAKARYNSHREKMHGKKY